MLSVDEFILKQISTQRSKRTYGHNFRSSDKLLRKPWAISFVSSDRLVKWSCARAKLVNQRKYFFSGFRLSRANVRLSKWKIGSEIATEA